MQQRDSIRRQTQSVTSNVPQNVEESVFVLVAMVRDAAIHGCVESKKLVSGDAQSRAPVRKVH